MIVSDLSAGLARAMVWMLARCDANRGIDIATLQAVSSDSAGRGMNIGGTPWNEYRRDAVE